MDQINIQLYSTLILAGEVVNRDTGVQIHMQIIHSCRNDTFVYVSLLGGFCLCRLIGTYVFFSEVPVTDRSKETKHNDMNKLASLVHQFFHEQL